MLERTTRTVSPTFEGERFLPIAERLIRDFDTAIFDLNATAERRSGHVNIAALPSIASQLLPGIIKSFSDRYPGISVQVTDDNSKGVQRRLVRNEVDLGLGSRWQAEPSLSYRPLIQDHIELLCHKDHPLGQEDGPVERSALEGHRFLDSGLSGLLPTKNLMGSPRFEFSTTTTLYAMIKANIGVTVLPTLAARKHDPRLVARTLVNPIVYRDVYLITRNEWTLSPAGQAMVEELVDRLPKILEELGLDNIKNKIQPAAFADLL